MAIVGSRTVGKDNLITVGKKVTEYINTLNKSEDIVISGGADSGADYWAKRICKDQRRPYIEAPAFWIPNNNHGNVDKSAGPRRNTTIALACTELVAFWDGKSRGTADVVKKAQELGRPIKVIPI